jgi:cell division transport system permease protein
MFTSLTRVFKYALQNFTRNIWLSTATIVIMVLALFVLAGLILFNVSTKTVITSIQDQIDISVFFKATTAEDDMLRIKSALETYPEVKEVDYISKEKALQIFKERHEGDDTISQAVEQLQENPLLASLSIKAEDTEQYGTIAGYLEGDTIKPYVEKVSYSQSSAVIDRLNKILNTAERAGYALIIFMSFVAVLITFNTIRLAIYSSRENINIMRLVGGSNVFIRGPFLVEGILYGIVSALISMILIAPVLYALAPYGNVLVPELDIWEYFTSHLPVLLIYQILFGIVLGLISSFIAIGKYLKN